MNEIFKRVSIRKYEDKPVEQEKIEKVLRAAMAAPVVLVPCYRTEGLIFPALAQIDMANATSKNAILGNKGNREHILVAFYYPKSRSLFRNRQ
ncbi:MAG: nitroreductase family protein [Agathobacter sp.]|uniref:nitroreductase family protein n=1 Tax=Agathobacter sp. TaxID=2021311 RepID=UPI002ED302AF|nr:nitroreductase family protein [Agathobacter sp.]